MTGKGRIFLSLSIVILLILGLGSALAQKTPSAKDLVRGAEADQKANRWEAAYEKLKAAAAQKPKDKNIAESLRVTETYLADSAAVRAITACNNNEFDRCEKELKTATTYAATARVKEAQTTLAGRRKDADDQWNKVQQMITQGELAQASVELENLNRYSYLLPKLSSEKERVLRLRITTAVETGKQEMAAQRWDAAIESFTAALRLDPKNADAAKALETARIEKDAATAFQQAQNAYQARSYQIAYEADQKAIKLVGGRSPYRELESRIAADWSKVLIEESRKLSANVDSLQDNQKAYDDLETIRRLSPNYEGLADEMRVVRTALHSMYIQKAGEYQAIADNSRIALAYLYYLNAQQTNPGGEFAFSAKLREAQGVFARKRAIQVLVNVDNISPAPASFAEVVTRRIRAVIEQLSLTDMKMRTLDDYQKNPAEDPQFVELRPGGKSPTMLVGALITNYEAENLGGDKPLDKPSKFIAGQESVPNPNYAKVEAKYREISAALARDKPKPGKTTREGYRADDLDIYKQQLATTPRDIVKDKIADYTYQEFQLTVRGLIKLNLEVRDYLEKQLLGSDPISAAQERSQVEVVGVKDKDVNQLTNKAARLPSVDQLSRECERDALQQVDDKVRTLVQRYLQRFYQEGEKALRENRREDAAENFLCHWHLMRGRMDEKQAQVVRDTVKAVTGLDVAATSGTPSTI
jgi:hypothetical protein